MRAESHKSTEAEFLSWVSDIKDELLDNMSVAIKRVVPIFSEKTTLSILYLKCKINI